MAKTQKLVISAVLAATLKPLLSGFVVGSGNLWNNARDAFNASRAEFPDPKDASKACASYIRDELHGDPGSIRAYMSHLVWLVEMKHDTATITMQQATVARYPNRAVVAKDDLRGRAAKLLAQAEKKDADKAASAEKQAKVEAEQAEADKRDPRLPVMRNIVALIPLCDLAQLTRFLAELEEATAVTEPEASDDDAIERELAELEREAA